MASLRRPTVARPFLGQTAPDGRAPCCWCGTPVSGRRVSWCSDVCVQRFQIASGDQGACRRYLRKLQGGTCQLCFVNVPKRRREIIEKHGFVPAALVHLTKWDADHIVPLCEGGKHATDNLRTLCRPCHKGETRALHERRKMARGRL